MLMLNNNLLVTTESLETYQIGETYFVTHPLTGELHEITTGRGVTPEEWEAFLKFKCGQANK